MIVQSLANIELMKEIYNKKKIEMEYQKAPNNNSRTIAIIINIAEYSEGKKKFMEEQDKYHNNNLCIYLLEYDKIRKLKNTFYFDSDFKFEYAFFSEYSYYSTLNKDQILEKIKEESNNFDDIIIFF
jgi:hypothetical protein